MLCGTGYVQKIAVVEFVKRRSERKWLSDYMEHVCPKKVSEEEEELKHD